jgi:uncharacterized protein (DUF302 family)
MHYTTEITLDRPYGETVARVKEAFQKQGFGTLTEIDVQTTLRDKLGEDVEPYVILGLCNPQLAHRALEVEPRIGTLLPCNVVVRRVGGKTVVDALDPAVMAEIPERQELRPIADEAADLVRTALDDLLETTSTA